MRNYLIDLSTKTIPNSISQIGGSFSIYLIYVLAFLAPPYSIPQLGGRGGGYTKRIKIP
jgi:hypothetical protein